MKKILILYGSYGGGHLSAAKAIKQYLDDNYEVRTEMIDCIEYVNKFLNKLTTGAYKWMAKKAPGLWGRIYSNSQKGIFAHISMRANKIMSKKLSKLILSENPDLVISTHPFSSQMVSHLRKKGKVNCKLVTVMTDFAPHDQWLVGHEYADAFFVANENMKKYLIDFGIDEKKVHATGIPLSLKFSGTFNKEEIYKEFELDSSKPVILFFGGGEFGLGKDRTLQVLDALIHNLATYQIVAISGRNKKMNLGFKNLVNKANAQDRVKIFEYVNKVPELMSISTIVVSKPGGLTTSESLASHLPMLVINPIAGQEEENAGFLENHNVAIWLRKKDEPNKVIQDLFENPDKITQMKENTNSLARPNSTIDICKISMDLVT